MGAPDTAFYRGQESKSLKVMHITHDLAVGGLQRVVVTLCKMTDANRFQTSVLCLRKAGPLESELRERGIPVLTLPRLRKGQTDYGAFLKVAAVLRARRIDVIHTHNTQPMTDGTLGALIAGVRTIIHTDHARQFPDKRRYMIAERLASSFVFRVIGVSEDTSANLTTFEKIPRRRIATIPNGVDPEPFTKPIDCGRVRQGLGVSVRAPLVGTIARLNPEKKLEDAIEAFALVKKVKRNARFCIVGEGPCEQSLRELAEARQLGESVIFTGRRTNIAEIVRVFDVFVLSSAREGLPMAVLEAMAGGCPVAAYAVGGVPHAVRNAETGFLVPPGNSTALAERLIELLDDESLRLRFGEMARKFFCERFSAESMTRAYERLYLREP